MCWVLISFAILFPLSASEQNQVSATATPRRVTLPSATPIPTSGSSPTPTQTATEVPPENGGILLQALETAGEVNVRIDGDIDADRVGAIQFGDTHVVTGRYFRWFRIRFDPSPTGQAFVFEDLVQIVQGDVSLIPDLALQDSDIPIQNTPIPESVPQTNTPDVRQLTPPSGAGVVIPENGDNEILSGILPTFTYPPQLSTITSTPNSDTNQPGDDREIDENTSNNLPNQIAPITPILILGALGALGLLFSSLRR